MLGCNLLQRLFSLLILASQHLICTSSRQIQTWTRKWVLMDWRTINLMKNKIICPFKCHHSRSRSVLMDLLAYSWWIYLQGFPCSNWCLKPWYSKNKINGSRSSTAGEQRISFLDENMTLGDRIEVLVWSWPLNEVYPDKEIAQVNSTSQPLIYPGYTRFLCKSLLIDQGV